MYIISKDERANRIDSDEAAHHELPHLNLHCLQIQLFSFLGTALSESLFSALYATDLLRKLIFVFA